MDSGPPFVGSPTAQIHRLIGDIKELCAPGQQLDGACSAEQLRQSASWNGPDGILVEALHAGHLNGGQAEILHDALNRFEVLPRRGRQAVCRLVHFLFRLRKQGQREGGGWSTDEPATASPCVHEHERSGSFVGRPGLQTSR